MEYKWLALLTYTTKQAPKSGKKTTIIIYAPTFSSATRCILDAASDQLSAVTVSVLSMVRHRDDRVEKALELPF